MNWRRRRSSSPLGTGGVASSAGVVDGSNNSPPHSFIGIKENHFDFTTTPALRATPPVPGGALLLPLLHSFTPSQTAPTGSMNSRDYFCGRTGAASGQTQPSDGRRSSVMREIVLISRSFIGLPVAMTNSPAFKE